MTSREVKTGQTGKDGQVRLHRGNGAAMGRCSVLRLPCTEHLRLEGSPGERGGGRMGTWG